MQNCSKETWVVEVAEKEYLLSTYVLMEISNHRRIVGGYDNTVGTSLRPESRKQFQNIASHDIQTATALRLKATDLKLL